MKTCKLFVASSMKKEWRNEFSSIEQKVNNSLIARGLNIECKLIAYSHHPSIDHGPDTQQSLNNQAASSDMFILMANNNDIVGKYTMQEFDVAESQYMNSGAPCIKVFVAKSKNDNSVSLSYRDMNDVIHNDFEDYVNKKLGLYIQPVEENDFIDFIKDWLIINIEDMYYGAVSQSLLSYQSHIHKIRQGGIRNSENKYYRRDNIDGVIEQKISKSPIIILEGNTYSGKTRAAYELMRKNKEWEKYRFHIYNSNSRIEDLNAIRPNMANRGEGLGDVYLIDDINEILDKGDLDRKAHNLWAKLNGYNSGAGFSLESMGSTRIIITISGRLSSKERERIYQKIFNVNHARTLEKIDEDVVVKFDIYNKISFRQMVDDMVRDGVLSKKDVVKGNYTIGSLFIKSEDVENEIKEFLEARRDDTNIRNSQIYLLCALVGHYKYAVRSKFFAHETEIKELYKYLGGDEGLFEEYKDRLRQRGLVVVDKESIFVDLSIVEYLAKAICQYGSINAMRLNERLISYAAKCQETRNSSNRDQHHIFSICQMGYLLCDRNTLSNEEIDNLVILVTRAYFNNVFRILKDRTEDSYRFQFFATAYTRYQDFNRSADKIARLYNRYQECSNELCDIIRELYKRTTYAMLSKSNRVMTLSQEHKILNYIFDEMGNWKAPFCEKDLEDIFNLVRISPFIDLSPEEIINFASRATIDGYDMSCCTAERSQDIDYDEFDDDYDDVENAEVENTANTFGENFYRVVFLNQISYALISAFCKVQNYEEFEEVLGFINKGCERSEHLQNAVQQRLPFNFYKYIDDIANGLSYEDRYNLFKYLKEGKDSALFGGELSDNNIILRTHALNKLLEMLDENDALDACKWMFEAGCSDNRTFSILLKNEFLNFEQVLPLIEKYDKAKNFITLNQMMKKADTISDAHACMYLMGITNDNPSKLKDEYALTQYIHIKDVGRKQMIAILKGWREIYPQNRLSDSALNVILHKYSTEDLFDIIMGDIREDDDNHYKDNYGLIASEVRMIRDNAKLINILFKKVNQNNDDKNVCRIKRLFNDIVNDPGRRTLVTDPNKDAENSILSVYLKNMVIFPTYDCMKRWGDAFIAKYNIRKSNNIYSNYIYNEVLRGELENINTLLIEAYNDFVDNYTRVEIAKMMPKLYNFIPLVVKGDFNTPMRFAYNEGYAIVGGRNEITFKEYLKFLLDENPSYVDRTFIYNTLRTMADPIDEDIYELLRKFAERNHIGIKYDTIYKKKENSKNFILPEGVRNRLMSCENGVLSLDSVLVSSYSRSKVLLFMIKGRKMCFEQAEQYRKDNNILITQTYLNFAFKQMESQINDEYKNANYKTEILVEGYERMKAYMDEALGKVSYLHKSIQMCLSLIAIAPDIKTLDNIFDEDGFDKYRSRVEVMGARMIKRIHLSSKQPVARELVDEFKKEIQSSDRDMINITIINTYLMAMILILRGEIRYERGEKCILEEVQNILDRSWLTLCRDGKIDIDELLGNERNNDADYKEWKVSANVQTYSYFAICCPDIISLMYSKFNGNFKFDDKEKKSCLKDAIKNYSFAYENDSSYPFSEVERISEILDENGWDVRQELYDEYILQSKCRYKDGEKIWNKMNYLWSDLLWCPAFKRQFIHHTCHLAMSMAKYTENRTPQLARLDLSDTQRINLICEETSLQRLEENIQDREYMKGDEKLINEFTVCIQKIRDCRSMIEAIIASSEGKPNERYAKKAGEILDALFFVEVASNDSKI